MEQTVSVIDFDQMNNSLREITNKLSDLKPKKKMDLVSPLALFVSILALVSTILWNQNNMKSQHEIQAFANWQNFLSLAVNNPELANGLDSINGKSITEIADKKNRYEIKKDTLTYNKYIKYTWFVADALASAESVYNVQNSDTAWQNTINEALRGHKALFDARVFDLSSYDSGFRDLIEKSFTK